MKKYINWITVIAVSLMVSSCSNDLEISNTNSLTDAEIAELLKTANATTTNTILSQIAGGLDGAFREVGSFNGFTGGLSNNIQGQDLLNDLSANDIVYSTQGLVGASGSDSNYLFYVMDNNAYQPWLASSTSYNMPWWNLASTPRNVAAKPLKYLTAAVVNSPSSQSVLKSYRAQALSAMAYGYMLLMERFQKDYLHGGKDGKGMPIYMDYKVNSPVAPSSAVVTYDSIKSWLTSAVKLFKAYDTTNGGYTSTTLPKADPKQVDCGVAQFLLAKADLETGDYAGCITACQDILTHYPSFIAEANYGIKASKMSDLVAGNYDMKTADNAFLSVAANPECILGWLDGAGAMTYYNLELNPFASASTIFYRMDDKLYNLIDANDYRKDVVTTSDYDYTYLNSKANSVTHTITNYASLKYGATIAKGQTTRDANFVNCDYTYFRSSEVWLMLAEAQYMNGDEPSAKNTLNSLLAARTRSGATTMTCANYDNGAYASKTLDLIKLQWRIEMWGENGLDYKNAKRWNTAIDRTGSTLHWSIGMTLPIEDMTWAIPNIETNFNPYW